MKETERGLSCLGANLYAKEYGKMTNLLKGK